MGAPQYLGESLYLLNVVLSEPLALFEHMHNIFVHVVYLFGFRVILFIDQLNQSSWVILETLFVHLLEVIFSVDRTSDHLDGWVFKGALGVINVFVELALSLDSFCDDCAGGDTHKAGQTSLHVILHKFVGAWQSVLLDPVQVLLHSVH